MKKHYFHTDALICIVVAFALSLGGNLFLFTEMRQLSTENVQMRIQAQLDALNLDSLKQALQACKDKNDTSNES